MSDSTSSGINTEQKSASASGLLSQSNEAIFVKGDNATTNITNSSITVIAGNSSSVPTKRAKFDDNFDVVAGNSNVEESLARNFQTHVNAHSLKQSVGGVTDSFDEQNLQEPSLEANPRMIKLTRFYRGELAPKKSDYKRDPIFYTDDSEKDNDSEEADDSAEGDDSEEDDDSKEADESEEPDDDKMISPQDLIEAISDKKHRVVAVIGQAGSGKTTLIKRLVRDIIISNNLTKSQTPGGISVKHFTDQEHKFEFVHFLNFKDLDMGGNRVTAKELLFSRHLEQANEEEIQCGYEWLKKNQAKVLFIFDGLDQANWTMPTKFENMSHSTEAGVEVVLANIICGHLFKDVQILLSSREHSVASLTTKLRPNVVVALMGLPLEDIEIVFNDLVKSENDDGNENFKTLPPAIVPLCSIPLFLIYCAIIYKKCPTYQPSTMTAVLIKILQIFIRSDHAYEEDIPRIIAIFKKISFDGHLQKRVTFTLLELDKYGLNRKMIRGRFMSKVPGSSVLSQNLFDGDYRIFFAHQTLQEILAAMYVCMKEVDDFRSFARNELVEPHWSVVRRFVCGLLSNPKCQDSVIFGINQKSEKWMILKETLQNTADSDSSSKRLESLALLYESQDIDLIQSLVTEIDFVNKTFTPAGIHAISSVIRCCQHLRLLSLVKCCINRELAEVLDHTTRNSKLKVRVLDVSWNRELGENNGFFFIGSTVANLKAEEVVIEFCGLGQNGLEDFIEGACDAKIRKLDVSGNEKLRQNNGFVSLGSAVAHFEAEEVDISFCELEENDLKDFIRGAGDAKIRRLDVGHNNELKRNNGFVALGLAVAHFEAEEVVMEHCELEENDFKDFIRGAGDAKIKLFDLCSNHVNESWTLHFMGEDGLSAITNIVHRNKVEILKMKYCNFEKEQIEKFKKSIPGVDFRY